MTIARNGWKEFLYAKIMQLNVTFNCIILEFRNPIEPQNVCALLSCYVGAILSQLTWKINLILSFLILSCREDPLEYLSASSQQDNPYASHSSLPPPNAPTMNGPSSQYGRYTDSPNSLHSAGSGQRNNLSKNNVSIPHFGGVMAKFCI